MLRPQSSILKKQLKLPSTKLLALGILVVGAAILGYGYWKEKEQVSEIAGQISAPTEGAIPAAGGNPVPQEAQLDVTSGEEILRLVNEYRKSQNLPEIAKNDRFCEFANSRAKMIASDFSQKVFAEQQDYIFRAVCLKCKKIGELISRNAANSKEVVDRWAANPDTKTTLDYPYNIGCVGGFSPDQQQAFVALELGEKIQ